MAGCALDQIRSAAGVRLLGSVGRGSCGLLSTYRRLHRGNGDAKHRHRTAGKESVNFSSHDFHNVGAFRASLKAFAVKVEPAPGILRKSQFSLCSARLQASTCWPSRTATLKGGATNASPPCFTTQAILSPSAQEPAPQIAVGGALGLNLHVQPAVPEVRDLIGRQFNRPAECALYCLRNRQI